MGVYDDVAQAVEDASNEQASETETTEQTEPVEETSQLDEQTDEPEPLTAPINWESGTREYFSTLDETGKQKFMDHYKNLESGYNKKYEDIARQKKTFESVFEALTPIKNDFNSVGMDEAGAVRFLAAAHQRIMQNPQEGIQWVAQQYGIDLNQYQYEQSNDYANVYDPRVDSLQKKLESFESQAKQTQEQQIQTQLTSFQNEKDDSGNLKHPFFDQVKQRMGQVIQSGAANSLEQAYQMAIAGDSELSAKQVQLIKEAEEKKRREEAKRAGRAARQVQGSSSANVNQAETTNRRDMIEKLVNQQFW